MTSHASLRTLPWVWPGCVLASCAAFALMVSISPAIPCSPLVAYLIAFACVSASTLLTSWVVPVTHARSLVFLALPIGALAFLGLTPLHAIDPWLFGCLVLGSLLTGGTLLGSSVGARVQAAGHLLFVALVSSAADVFSVYAPTGPTSALVDSPAALSLLALPWPMLGSDHIAPILGVGDVVFASLYRSAGRAHALNEVRTAIALTAGFALTLIALLVVQQPIPALPFFGLAFVLAHPQARAVPAADRKHGWIGVIALGLVLVLLARYRPETDRARPVGPFFHGPNEL